MRQTIEICVNCRRQYGYCHCGASIWQRYHKGTERGADRRKGKENLEPYRTHLYFMHPLGEGMQCRRRSERRNEG